MAQIRDISKRTALYERLSKDDEQQGESNSILNQKQYLEEYAHKNGFVNIQHFTDDGYTGRNFNRPGFQEMLAEIENGKIGTVIVKDMSRFGRNYLQVGFYTEMMFPQKQVRFIAINNSVDSDKPQDNDFTPFLNIMNEWYAKDTSNKIKSIFLSRMNDGKRCSGSIPYGYNRLPGDKQTFAKHIAFELGLLKAIDPTLQPIVSFVDGVRIVVSGGGKHIDVAELIVGLVQRIQTVEQRLHLPAHLIIVDRCSEDNNLGFLDLCHDFGYIILQYTTAGFLAGHASDAEPDIFAAQGHEFNLMPRILRAALAFLCQNLRIAVSAQAGGNYKNLLCHR